MLIIICYSIQIYSLKKPSFLLIKDNKSNYQSMKNSTPTKKDRQSIQLQNPTRLSMDSTFEFQLHQEFVESQSQSIKADLNQGRPQKENDFELDELVRNQEQFQQNLVHQIEKLDLTFNESLDRYKSCLNALDERMDQILKIIKLNPKLSHSVNL